MGLGLAIVKHLVELHGGTVRVKSPGVSLGCTFTVLLPLAAVQAENDANRRHPSAPSYPPDLDDTPRLDNARVLIVEDEEDSLKLLAKMLEKAGATVTATDASTEALNLVKTGHFDVLVSDIGMPELNGYDLIRKIRALRPEQGGAIPAIALTAYARMEDRIKALESGFQMHIAKPAHKLELIAVVKSLITKKG